MIDTAIWSDERVSDLSPHAQLVYLRVILGDDTGPAGATRAAVKRLAVDTNLDRGDVEAALEELTKTGLVRVYDGGWMWLPAFIKYQLSGPQFIRGIRRQAAECPDALRKAINRATDAIVGPGKEKIATNRENRSDTNTPPGDEPRTRKAGTSRGSSDSPTTVPGQKNDERQSDGGLFEREVQDQDQDQDRPNGLSVLVKGDANNNGDGPGQAMGRPSPAPDRRTQLEEFNQQAKAVLEHLTAEDADLDDDPDTF